MFLDMQQRLAQQWIDLAATGLRVMTDATIGAAQETSRALDRASEAAAPTPPSHLAAFGWGWPMQARTAPVPSWPGWSWPPAFAPSMAPFGQWPLWGASPMAAAWTWPLTLWHQALPAAFTAGLPMQAFAMQPARTLPLGPAQSPMGQALELGGAVAAAYRSAGGYAAAILMPPQQPARAPEPPQLPWPLALWQPFLPPR